MGKNRGRLDEKEILELSRNTYNIIANEFASILRKDNSSEEEMNTIDLFLKKLDKSAVIADLGCGLGKHGRYCAEKGFTVYGFDISNKMIEIAEQYNHITGYAQMKVLRIADMSNFECEQKFDAVISAYAFIHLLKEQAENALRNLHHHLNDSALICLIVYQGDRDNVFKEFLAPNHYLYYKDYKKDEFINLVKRAGYVIEDVKEWSDLDPITASNLKDDARVLCVIARNSEEGVYESNHIEFN